MASNKRPLRIAFVVGNFSMGGIATRMLKLLRAIDRERYSPVLISGRDKGNQADLFSELGVPVYATRGLLPVNRLIQFLEVFRILWLTRTRRFDAIVSFLPTSQPFEIYLSVLGCRKRRFAYTLVNRRWEGARVYWDKRKVLAGQVVAISHKTAEFFYEPHDPVWEKLRVIPNGVDLQRFSKTSLQGAVVKCDFGLPEASVIVVYPARIAVQKQHEVFLQVARKVARQVGNVHFVIAGQDKRNGWLQNEIQRLALKDIITYLGPVRNIERLLAISDILLMTSVTEGCPNALLESMSMELPAVVTRSGAEEFVTEGITGFTSETGDVESLAAQVALLVSDSSLRLAMGKNARQWMEISGGIDTMLDAWHCLFSDLAKS